ncbi:MAG: MgtC/SapB family protein [Desulfarculus sp.]|nr:MgtC/SapB family protein [Desulfarculus sp.]
MYVDDQTMILRMVLAAGLGLLVGFERERHGRAAGLRTYMLVAMAGAMLMGLSLHLAQMFEAAGTASSFRLDPGRIPSYAIAGMGFLGAGAIIQGSLSARGVTTAAAMWTCTGVGLAVGSGLYWPSLAAVALVLVALNLLRPLAHLIPHEQYVILTVEATASDVRQTLRGLLKQYGIKILFAGRERCLMSGTVKHKYSLLVPSGQQWNEMLLQLEAIPGVTCYSWLEDKVP